MADEILQIDGNHHSASGGITNDANEEIRNVRIDEGTKSVLMFDATAYKEIAMGNVPGLSLIHKFGAANLTNVLLSVTQDNRYPTPLTAVSLEFLSNSTADNPAGIGATEITVNGLDANWIEQTVVFATNGTTRVAVPGTWTRVLTWHVSKSGTYGRDGSGSHVGILTLDEPGVEIWSTIIITPFPLGQSQIGVYTVPKGKTGYLLSKNVFVDRAKTADIYFFQRPCADDVVAPYDGTIRLIEREVGVVGGFSLKTIAPKGPFVGPCEVGFMGTSGSPSECSVEFELLIVDD